MKEMRRVEKMSEQNKKEENLGYPDIQMLLDDIYDKFEELAKEAIHAKEERKEEIDEIMSHFYYDLLDAANTIGEVD